MIEAFRKIWRFAGEEQKNINKSVAVSFLSAVLQMSVSVSCSKGRAASWEKRAPFKSA